MSSVQVEKANIIYARVIEIFTIAGLVVMIVGLVLYLTGQVPVFVDLDKLAKYWGCKAKTFWQAVRGEELPYGYEWIFTNLNYADIISVAGVVLLPIGVIIAILAACGAYAGKRDRMLAAAITVFVIMLIALLGPYLGIKLGH